jgi:hypothetical protein
MIFLELSLYYNKVHRYSRPQTLTWEKILSSPIDDHVCIRFILLVFAILFMMIIMSAMNWLRMRHVLMGIPAGRVEVL